MKKQWLLILTLLIGCSENSVKDINDTNNAASFDLDRVQMVSFETRASNSKWPDIKDQAVVALRTCIRDTQFLESIVGEEFKIESDASSSEQNSNTNGCISWTEEFEFNYLADESYFQLDGVITGLDNFKGRRSYSVAVNPWLQNIIDLQENSNVTSLALFEDVQVKSASTKHLEASRFNITVLEKSFRDNQTKLKLDISTSPEILRRGLDGDLIKMPLTGGEFQVDYLIIAKSLDTNQRTVLAQTSRELNVQDDGFLRAAVDFELNNGINPNSQIELGIKIIPLGMRDDLGQDEGIIALTQLDGSMSGELLSISVPFDFIASQKTIIKNTNAEFGFVLDRINIQRGSEGGSNLGGTSSDSQVDAILEVRMVDPLVHSDIKNHTFQVDLIEQESNEVVYSDSVATLTGSGVISFRATLLFKRYNTRKWKPYILRVSSTQSPYTNITKERIVHINPWISTSDFGIDSKIGTPPASDTENIPEIFIDKFDYRFIGNIENSFELNKNLDLKYDKRLRVEFRPKLKVDHDFSGGANVAYENIVNGRYQLRVMILAPKNVETFNTTREINLDEFYTLTADDTLVDVRDGLVSGDIDLPLLFTDQIIFATKNLALVELRSVEENTELRPGYFVGMFSGYKKRGTVQNAEANSLRLSSGNVDIALQLAAKIDSVKNKMANLGVERNAFTVFLERLRAIRPERNVFNHQSFRMQRVRSSIQTYTTEQRFKSAKSLTSSDASIREMVLNPSNTNQDLLHELCGLMFNKNERTVERHIFPRSGGISYNPPSEIVKVGIHYKACKAEPFKYIDFSQLQHVDQITEQPRDPVVESLTLSRSQAYFVSRGQNFVTAEGVRESDYFSHGWHVGAGIEKGKWGLYGAMKYDFSGGHRTDIYTMDSDAEVLSSLNRIINQDGFTLAYDRFDINFKASVKSCVLIAGKDVEIELPQRYVNHTLASTFRDSDKPSGIIASPRRLYVCSGSRQNISRQESWYFVRADKTSTMADESLSKNSMLNVIRGVKNFEGFRQNQIESDKVLVIQESDDATVVENYQNYLENRGSNITYKDRLGVGFPGLLE